MMSGDAAEGRAWHLLGVGGANAVLQMSSEEVRTCFNLWPYGVAPRKRPKSVTLTASRSRLRVLAVDGGQRCPCQVSEDREGSTASVCGWALAAAASPGMGAHP